MSLDVTTIVSTFVTLAATYLSHLLRDKRNHLPHGANVAIALVAMVILLGLMFWLTTDLSGDLKHNVIVFLAFAVSALSYGKELWSLWQILDDSPSPLAPTPDPIQPAIRRASLPPDLRGGNGG